MPVARTDWFLLYLHGFNSSPDSKKARQTLDWFTRHGLADRIAIPQLDTEPAAAIRLLQSLIESRTERVALLGSSLGGFYATWLAEEYDLRAVLVNPAVRPYERWEMHLGVQRNYYTGEEYTVTREHIDQLALLERHPLTKPANFLLLAQTGDEVLDYRQAVEKYQDSARIIQQGGDHSFVNFEAMLPQIIDFLSSPRP
jgi:uncharacterized protein